MTTKELLVAALQRVVDDVMHAGNNRVSDEGLDQARAILASVRPVMERRIKRRELRQQLEQLERLERQQKR